ncbi:MAG: gamma-glutamylcyclotransferase [Candidatus Protistobacter heckmanni]|nr:gamma-glutamylcyclotransferase [Candidatus Protistobacter heckmanni]
MPAASPVGLPAAPVLRTQAAAPGRLVDFGLYPGWLRDGEGSVVGEVYDIVPELLPLLDAIEEVDYTRPGEFLRETLQILTSKGSLSCLVYPANPALAAHLPDISGGDWVAHRKTRK